MGPARSSVGPGGCNLVTSPPLWAGSGVLPLQVKQGVCKSPLLGVQEPEVLGQGFPGAALLLSLSALLASVLDVDASAAPTRSPPQTFPVARSKSEWRGPGMETKRTLQPSSESMPSFPCPGIQAGQTAYERRGRGYGRGPHSLGDPPGLGPRRGRRPRILPLLPEPPPGTAAAPVEALPTKPRKCLKLILVPEAARVTHRVRGLQALDERPTLRLISRAASFVTSR